MVDMIVSHSQYKTVLMPVPIVKPDTRAIVKPSRESDLLSHAKVTVAELLLTLMSLDAANGCRLELLPDLVLSYQGTTSRFDQVLLSIFSVYEVKAGISMSSFLLHWRGSSSNSLSGATGVIAPSLAAESLAGVDSFWVSKTLHVFPSPSSLVSSDWIGEYDTNFIFPLLASALVHGRDKLDIRSLLESNAVGLAVMGLSSEYSNIRKTCFFILDEVYVSLLVSFVFSFHSICYG